MTELREFLDALRWRGVVLGVAAMAAFVALCLVPPTACTLRVRSEPTPTTPTPTTEVESLPSMAESPVWVWDDETDTFVCVPGGDDPSVCDGRTWDDGQ